MRGKAWTLGAIAGDLRRIVEAHARDIPATAPPEADFYARTDDEGLLDVYGNMNRASHPTRFAALLWTIAERCRR
jgi:hypothetical protein